MRSPVSIVYYRRPFANQILTHRGLAAPPRPSKAYSAYFHINCLLVVFYVDKARREIRSDTADPLFLINSLAARNMPHPLKSVTRPAVH